METVKEINKIILPAAPAVPKVPVSQSTKVQNHTRTSITHSRDLEPPAGRTVPNLPNEFKVPAFLFLVGRFCHASATMLVKF